MTTLTLLDHAYVLALCMLFLVALTVVQPGISGQKFSTGDKMATYWGQSLLLYLIAGVGLLIWLWNGRQAVELGFAWPGRQNRVAYVWLTILFLLLYAVDLAVGCLLPGKREIAAARWREHTPFLPENRVELIHGLQLAFCAGVTEEIVFRGYLINYFVRLFSGRPLSDLASPSSSFGVIAAIVITSLIFGLSHLYLGWRDAIKVALLSVMFGFIFTLSRSLLLVVLLHILVDVIANLISPWIAAASSDPRAGFETPVSSDEYQDTGIRGP